MGLSRVLAIQDCKPLRALILKEYESTYISLGDVKDTDTELRVSLLESMLRIFSCPGKLISISPSPSFLPMCPSCFGEIFFDNQVSYS